MAELAGDRLASGGSFGRIIIWNLADFSQLASLEGHRDFVRCLVALDGGLLASGSGDMTIRVRPLLDEATRRIMECSSAFEFECLAGEYCKANELGDLLAAALQQFEECPVGRESSSATITRQAHVFDAISKVIRPDDDNTALVEGLLDLVHDDDLLPEMKRRDLCGNQNFTSRSRHRRDVSSMAWRCQFLTARRGQHGRVIAEK